MTNQVPSSHNKSRKRLPVPQAAVEKPQKKKVTASLGAANKISRNAEVGVVLSELGSDKTSPSFIMGLSDFFFSFQVDFIILNSSFYEIT